MSAILSSPVLCLVCRKYIEINAEVDFVHDRVLHAACAVKLRERREEERQDALARGQCRRCHGPLGQSPTFELYQGQMDAFHAECWARIEELDREREEHARNRDVLVAVSQTKGSWGRSWHGVVREHDSLLHPPRWEWASFENEDFTSRVAEPFLRAVQTWKPADGSLVLSGLTGKGKTSLVVAWLHRSLAQALQRAETERKPTSFSFAFISGHELVGARRNAKLGAEAPLVNLAKDQHLLILDEIGSEPLSEVVFEVVDHRYRGSAPTVLTTGLRPKEFRARYGDAMWRRLAERGAVVEAWK